MNNKRIDNKKKVIKRDKFLYYEQAPWGRVYNIIERGLRLNYITILDIHCHVHNNFLDYADCLWYY